MLRDPCESNEGPLTFWKSFARRLIKFKPWLMNKLDVTAVEGGLIRREKAQFSERRRRRKKEMENGWKFCWDFLGEKRGTSEWTFSIAKEIKIGITNMEGDYNP